MFSDESGGKHYSEKTAAPSFLFVSKSRFVEAAI